MSNIINHQIRLAGRPVGLPKSSDWEFTEAAVPDLEIGQVLVKIHYISVDPAMRGWMNDRETYVPALRLGDVMRALTVGEVIASQNPIFATGEFVVGIDGVQEYAISDGSALTKADVGLAPLPAYLNSLGIAGLTAYCGLIEVGAPKAGEVVVVSGAASRVTVGSGGCSAGSSTTDAEVDSGSASTGSSVVIVESSAASETSVESPPHAAMSIRAVRAGRIRRAVRITERRYTSTIWTQGSGGGLGT